MSAVRLAHVLGAATTCPARHNAADGAELHGSLHLSAVPYVTLVTLDCTPFDIASSVSDVDSAVYSPAVLRLRDQLSPAPGQLGPPFC